MTEAKTGRYSKYIRPISILLDLAVINILPFYFFKQLNLDFHWFIPYQNIVWIGIAFLIKFYGVYRFTTPVDILSKLVRQGVLFLLLVIAFFPFAKETIFSGKAIALYMCSSMAIITVFKWSLFYYLKKYRIITGSNFRNAVIIGYTPEAIRLKQLFEERNDFGYRFYGFFSDKKSNENIKGKLDVLKDFVLANKIDEIYCSLNEISNEQLKDLVEFADEHKRSIKFIPDTKDIFSKNLKIDYYGFFPVLSLQRTMLHEPVVKGFKRGFDVFFSLFIIVFVLSWMIPILAIIIKIESKGPVFFKQGRPGIDETEFFCYKFRSMRMNLTTEKEASKNDPRVTKIGRILRKTSMDELPQFINVLVGDMSVVGPRPHLWSQNKAYGTRIKKYMVRHYVKPGITGLAQVRGFRGEIETDEDMINRIKFDVFYIENWSFLLDIKIILQTVINIFKGEEKAY
ncbi:exopolysaccharide biosynthesis polyprenyl glycosylphosphotransferase [Flavobacterium sp.]|uniref:exopolysaccharide biosynthesis polyprenyl glycosylphosphotransferase n=1 Tax=Flavobacterium sp. TaxID=239 RepID=UPI00120CD7A2|nr:exopolysaccharide biosynthesis polyprenyl glycosylphosphotransferase [Flavobacterium sp.]RZJ71976.1 MAG: exopolysaccharide biosynthesis polyprenyl glycosylphosphotransferase [Flavobacterium sp.]